jgi:hypothetical protein
MSRQTSFYFGRFNVLAVGEDKKEVLARGLQTEDFYESRNQRWGFFSVGRQESDLGDFLVGYLAKFKTVDEAEVAQLSTHSIEVESIENRIVAKSLFCLHMTTGLIAFHPVAGFISVSTFRDVFAKLFEKGLSNFFIDAEISMIDDRVEFFKVVKSFERILTIKIKLHPSNPHSGRMWKNVDELLKAREATTYTEEMRNDKPGGSLCIAEDEDINSKFMMAHDGYGAAAVTGSVANSTRTIRTNQNPITALVRGLRPDIDTVLEHLIKTFDRVMTRINEP